MARFDWYQGTVHGGQVEEVVSALLAASDLTDFRPGTPKNGYERGGELVRGSHKLAEVWWGGNPGVHVLGTGEDAPLVAEVLRGLGEHAVTRVDACRDFVEAGLFDRWSRALLDYATAHRITINQQGDWERGLARTLYLGSKDSAVRLVMYEKGYETGGNPDWVRLEVRVRPPRKAAKLRVSTWTPEDCFGAARWLVEAVQLLGLDAVRSESISTPWRPSDTERARAAMLRQYGRIISEWAVEVGGWEALGPVIEEALAGEGSRWRDAKEGAPCAGRLPLHPATA